MPLLKARKEKGSGDLDPRSCLRIISEMTNSGEPHRWDLSSGLPLPIHMQVDEKSNKSLCTEWAHSMHV